MHAPSRTEKARNGRREHVCSWFFIEDDSEADYAQVRGDASSEGFRDVYRRCIYLSFASARRAGPDAQLHLYLNQDWNPESSVTAGRVYRELKELGVVFHRLDYSHQPPATFTKKWRNQFFVFDVMADLLRRSAADDVAVIIDSDVLWSSKAGAESLWRDLSSGVRVLPLGFDEDAVENGLSSRTLAALLGREQPVEYFGGEFIGGPVAGLSHVLAASEDIYSTLMAAHGADPDLRFEEAHVLSAAYQTVGYERLAPRDLKRMWTQPFRYRNMEPGDELITLWHVPAEKRFGWRRLYRDVLGSGRFIMNADDADFRSSAEFVSESHATGAMKIAKDVVRAGLGRLSSNRV